MHHCLNFLFFVEKKNYSILMQGVGMTRCQKTHKKIMVIEMRFVSMCMEVYFVCVFGILS
jgi:hypothetical protein